jgi:hypothetical protein
MLLANREFNHETENFHESLGISDEVRVRCRERIFFNTFSNALQRLELFEDDDDAPKELRTVSGDLQRCLRTITDQLEYEYTLMIFNNTQRIAMESFAYYRHMLESHDNREDRIKLKIMELVEEMRGSKDNEEDDEEDPISRLNKKSMVKRIKLVKQSHYNFDTYLNMLNRWANGNTQDFTEKKPDIDDLLRNLFSNDED